MYFFVLFWRVSVSALCCRAARWPCLSRCVRLMRARLSLIALRCLPQTEHLVCIQTIECIPFHACATYTLTRMHTHKLTPHKLMRITHDAYTYAHRQSTWYAYTVEWIPFLNACVQATHSHAHAYFTPIPTDRCMHMIEILARYRISRACS